jgi:hypothetical protein
LLSKGGLLKKNMDISVMANSSDELDEFIAALLVGDLGASESCFWWEEQTSDAVKPSRWIRVYPQSKDRGTRHRSKKSFHTICHRGVCASWGGKKKKYYSTKLGVNLQRDIAYRKGFLKWLSDNFGSLLMGTM